MKCQRGAWGWKHVTTSIKEIWLFLNNIAKHGPQKMRIINATGSEFLTVYRPSGWKKSNWNKDYCSGFDPNMTMWTELSRKQPGIWKQVIISEHPPLSIDRREWCLTEFEEPKSKKKVMNWLRSQIEYGSKVLSGRESWSGKMEQRGNNRLWFAMVSRCRFDDPVWCTDLLDEETPWSPLDMRMKKNELIDSRDSLWLNCFYLGNESWPDNAKPGKLISLMSNYTHGIQNRRFWFGWSDRVCCSDRC